MSDLPPPDIMDEGGRLRRLVLALLVGAACGTAAYFIASSLTGGEADNPYNWKGGPTKFIWYMTAFFGAVGFVLTMGITEKIAKKKWMQSLVARAEVVKRD
jgi:hypothetical protein